MTHIIRTELPSVIARAFDAFRASDHVTVGEAFEQHAFFVSNIDPKLLKLLGIANQNRPIRSRGNLSISRQFAREFSMMQITHMEVYNELRVGRELAAMVDFEMKLLSTGQTLAARCSGLYTLNRTGRKVETARTVCKLITPHWNFVYN